MNQISSFESSIKINSNLNSARKSKVFFILKAWLPFFIFIGIEILWHCIISVGWRDDAFFKTYITSQDIPYPMSLIPAMEARWATWSSRVFIEAILCTFTLLPDFFWRIADIAIWCLMYESIRRLIKIKRGTLQDVTLVLLLTTYPFFQMSGAGWYATSINYSWPLAFGLFVISAARDMLTSRPTLFTYILVCVALLFSANQELMCVVLIASFILLISMSYRNRFVDNVHRFTSSKGTCAYLWILLGLSIIMLFFILLCPGNAARTISETATWAPQFETMGLFSKLHWGFIHIADYFIGTPYFSGICLLAVTVWLVFLQYKAGFAIKFLLCFALLVYFGVTLSAPLFPGIAQFFGPPLAPGLEGYAESIDILHSISAASFFLCYGVVVSWLAAKNKNCLVALVVLLIGFMVAGAMSFSPTVFASGERTLIITYFSLVIATLYLMKIIKINKSISSLAIWFCWFIIGVNALSQTITLWDFHY